MPKFSVLTPVHVGDEQRKAQLKRCVESVAKQSFTDFEHIVVDDGSVVPMDLPEYPWLKIIKHEHLERIIAYNAGLKESTGEWICFLDSDDEYASWYLEACNAMMEKFPEYKVFNFGAIFCHIGYDVTIRDPFEPKELEVGHEIFGGGTVVNGTFIFHRSCYEELGGFPHRWNPWDFSTDAQEEFPEIKPFFIVKDMKDSKYPEGTPKELGNPWGNDYYMFYKLTRKFHSKPVKSNLYIVHPSRKEHHL